MKFFVTYGNDSALRDCYSEIESNSFMSARQEADKVTEGKYAQFFDAREFGDRASRFELKKVPLQPATSVVW